MKRSVLFSILFISLFSTDIFAQSNTFPTTGNVGIGTINPLWPLTLASTSTITANTGIALSFEGESKPEIGYRFKANGLNYYQVIYNGSSIQWKHYLGAGNYQPRMTLTNSGNLGIGTISPVANLDIVSGRSTLRVAGNSGADSWRARILLDRGDNYRGAGLWIQASAESELDWYAGVPYTGAGFSIGYHGAQPEYRANSKLFIKPDGNVGIGTTTPTNKLEVNGKIRSKEVIVEATGWPDYVFADDYDLPTLAEIETYINTNKHLPGVPSAKQVEENGVSLGEMNALLLKKIEELTLYIIEQEKRIKKLEPQN